MAHSTFFPHLEARFGFKRVNPKIVNLFQEQNDKTEVASVELQLSLSFQYKKNREGWLVGVWDSDKYLSGIHPTEIPPKRILGGVL